jgi:hypothetical protein
VRLTPTLEVLHHLEGAVIRGQFSDGPPGKRQDDGGIEQALCGQLHGSSLRCQSSGQIYGSKLLGGSS